MGQRGLVDVAHRSPRAVAHAREKSLRSRAMSRTRVAASATSVSSSPTAWSSGGVTASGLLISWATPAARAPTEAILSEIMSCSVRCRFAVRSTTVASVRMGAPDSASCAVSTIWR